jgi:membrane protein
MSLRKRVRGIAGVWIDVFREHSLLTYASAVAFQALIALVPLTLLGFAVMGATGERSMWEQRMAPRIEAKLAEPTFVAVNYAVERILDAPSAWLILGGAAFAVWELAGSVRALMEALNAVHGEQERRPSRIRTPLSIGLSVVVAACLLGAIAAPLAARGAWSIGAWPLAILLLGLAVAALVRAAPVRKQPFRWVSIGAGLTVGAWVVSGLLFRFYVTDLASFTSPWGTFVLALVVMNFVYVNTIVFFVGVQLDELLEDGKLERFLKR